MFDECCYEGTVPLPWGNIDGFELPGPVTFQKGNYGKLDFDYLERIRGTKEAEKENLFTRLLLTMSPHHLRNMMERHKEIQGHCGNQVFLRYFGKGCDYKGTLKLPEEGAYRIERIDVWEMTRTEVAAGVNGIVSVELPGKPGMALVAWKMPEE